MSQPINADFILIVPRTPIGASGNTQLFFENIVVNAILSDRAWYQSLFHLFSFLFGF
jgi:hypothetical protein